MAVAAHIFVALGFCLLRAAEVMETDCKSDPSGACRSDEADDGGDAGALAQLRSHWLTSKPKHEPAPQPYCPPSGRALGVLQLDGYYWPTQPGDISDLRTFCSVRGIDGDAYRCKNLMQSGEDEFSLKFATVAGGSWSLIQGGKFPPELRRAFKQAVEFFLKDPSVRAIIGGAGWFTWYQYRVVELMRELVTENNNNGVTLKMKPWLGGSPAMLPAVGMLIGGLGDAGMQFVPIKGWDLLKKPTDRLMFLTSNSELLDVAKIKKFLVAAGLPIRSDSSWSEYAKVLTKEWGLDFLDTDNRCKALMVFLEQMHGLLEGTDNQQVLIAWIKRLAQKIIVIPWQDVLGYGVAVTFPGALFHNVPAVIHGSPQAAIPVLRGIVDSERKGCRVVGIFMESTEMPAYSNWVRNITGLPVWDSTVVGRCLMAAAPDYNADDAFAAGNGPTLFNTPSFQKCMMAWWDSDRWELRAGYQKNDRILHYDGLDLAESQLAALTCKGGRFLGRKVIGREMSQFFPGEFGPKKPHAACLTVTPCAGRTWEGMECPPDAIGGCICGGTCPGGYYCGSDTPVQFPGLSGAGTTLYVYGIRGDKFQNYTFMSG